MRGGALRSYAAFYQCVETRNAVGEREKNPANFPLLGHAWLRITQLRGSEGEFAKSIRADVTHEIKGRPTSFAVTPKDQIRYNGRTFEIVSINNVDERDRSIIYTCTEVAS